MTRAEAVSPTLALREGGADDLAAMSRIMNEAFDPAFGEAWTQAQCAGILDLPGVWLTLACDGATPVGFALGRVILDEAELLLLAVRPSRRRGGVGGALLARTCGLAAARGAARIHLEVRDGNSAAILYAHAGFTRVGRRPAYYRGATGRIFDAISLSRAIRCEQPPK